MNDELTPHILIDEYAIGRHMKVSDKKYTQDLKIIGNSVVGDWWRREGHLLAAEDISDITAASPDLLVVGTGYAGRMRISAGLKHLLDTRRIRLVYKPTSDAVQTFNQMRKEGKNVAGAFHLTC